MHLAAGVRIAAAVIATATPAIVAAAGPNDNQQDDNPAAVATAKAIITHMGTSYEILTDRSVSTHHMRSLALGSR